MTTELRRIDAPLSSFAEARAQLTAWELEYPNAERVVLVLDAGEDLLVTVTGEPIKLSMAAGLLFAAAHTVME